MSLGECRLITLPKISDPRGNLTFIEGGQHVPFEIKRVYYLYDVPVKETRGGHAHKTLEQFMIAVAGSFKLVVDDGSERREIHLNHSYCGIYIPRMIWRELEDFSSGSICLVIASDHYDEADYIRDYAEFMRAARGGGK